MAMFSVASLLTSLGLQLLCVWCTSTLSRADGAGSPVRVAPAPAEPAAFVQSKEGRAAFVERIAACLSSGTQAFILNSFFENNLKSLNIPLCPVNSVQSGVEGTCPQKVPIFVVL